jgi:excisionase family DNA binding protein
MDSQQLASATPWLTAREAAARARVGLKVIYRSARSGRLRSAKVGGRRELRFLAEWIDSWLIETSTPVETSRPLRVATTR